MEKRKYCIFSALYLPHMGGVERYTYNLAKKLVERGNDVTVVTSNIYRLLVYERIEGIHIYRLPCVNLLDGRYPVLKINKKFIKIHRMLMHKRYDLVIVNTRFYVHSLYGMIFAKMRKTPCITIEHGTGHLLIGNSLINKIGEIYEHLLTGLEKRICHDFYGVSMDAVKWLAHFHIRAKGVLYNSVDYEYIQTLCKDPGKDFRSEYGIPKEAVVITYTGRLIKEKGILTLIEAVEELHRRYLDVYLFVLGEGDLEQKIKEKKESFVLPLGKLEFEHVIALLKQTDIFCLPTDYPEGFPTSTLEAMSCRCYPVVSEKGGARELILDFSYGCVLKNNRTETVIKALEWAVTHKEERWKAAKKGQERVRRLFTWEHIAGQIEEIEVLPERKRLIKWKRFEKK